MVLFCLGRKKSSSRGAAKGKSSQTEGTTSELAMSNTSTPVKSGTSKKTSPAKQKLRRSPRKVVDKKKVGCLVGSAQCNCVSNSLDLLWCRADNVQG